MARFVLIQDSDLSHVEGLLDQTTCNFDRRFSRQILPDLDLADHRDVKQVPHLRWFVATELSIVEAAQTCDFVDEMCGLIGEQADDTGGVSRSAITKLCNDLCALFREQLPPHTFNKVESQKIGAGRSRDQRSWTSRGDRKF